MRLLAALTATLLATAPAAAQTPCEAHLTGKPGAVSAYVETDETLVVWVVQQTEGVGEESANFARPGLVLEFDVGSNQSLTLARVEPSITVVSGAVSGPAPNLAHVRVRAADGATPYDWTANRTRDAAKDLTKRWTAAWPSTVTLEATFENRTVASAQFDFTQLPDVQRLAREALAQCKR